MGRARPAAAALRAEMDKLTVKGDVVAKKYLALMKRSEKLNMQAYALDQQRIDIQAQIDLRRRALATLAHKTPDEINDGDERS